MPVVGDVSAASERAADPTGWAFPASERAAAYAVIEARRDVRRFRPDPIPDDVLRRVLGAAHVAPSVGHSQPWRFIVVRDPDIRTRAGLLADRERLRQAAQLEPDAARRLKDLKLEGLREAPIGIVVCCDRRTPAAGVLGRATFADADMWSCAAAIENLWLAARAEGLGLGWVTLFQPDDLAALMHLPAGVVTLGLAVPGLAGRTAARARPANGPAGRRASRSTTSSSPIDGRRPTGPHSRHRICADPMPAPLVTARDEGDRLLTPPGSLGVLDRAVERIVAVRGAETSTGTLILVAADHPVAGLGVSAFAPERNRPGVRGGRDRCGARRHGRDRCRPRRRVGRRWRESVGARSGAGRLDGNVARAEPYDASRCPPSRRPCTSDAMSDADAERFVDAGRVIGRAAGQRGLVALGEVGIGNTTVAACLTAALTGIDAADAVGLGAGADRTMLNRKRDIVEMAVTRWRSAAIPRRRADPYASDARRTGDRRLDRRGARCDRSGHGDACSTGSPPASPRCSPSRSSPRSPIISSPASAVGNAHMAACSPTSAASRCSTSGSDPARAWVPRSRRGSCCRPSRCGGVRLASPIDAGGGDAVGLTPTSIGA